MSRLTDAIGSNLGRYYYIPRITSLLRADIFPARPPGKRAERALSRARGGRTMARKITGSVVVLTGASSGIGRATALAFARRGANLVLASRHEASLRELAEECGKIGGSAVAAPTDVRDEEAMAQLARRAVESFGRID